MWRGLEHLEHLYYAANALLLVLCWIPPILSYWIKAGLTLNYLGGLCLIGFDGKDAFSQACVTYGVPGLKRLGAGFDGDTFPALQVQLAFTAFALTVLVALAVDVAQRHSSPYAEETDRV